VSHILYDCEVFDMLWWIIDAYDCGMLIF